MNGVVSKFIYIPLCLCFLALAANAELINNDFPIVNLMDNLDQSDLIQKLSHEIDPPWEDTSREPDQEEPVLCLKTGSKQFGPLEINLHVSPSIGQNSVNLNLDLMRSFDMLNSINSRQGFIEAMSPSKTHVLISPEVKKLFNQGVNLMSSRD